MELDDSKRSDFDDADLGYRCPGGPRRTNLLSALELPNGSVAAKIDATGMKTALTTPQLFGSLATRVGAQRAWSTTASGLWHFTDREETEVKSPVLV
ncbi:hypothetical protein ACWEOW_02290 [Monashia sp. NPDC004114]